MQWHAIPPFCNFANPSHMKHLVSSWKSLLCFAVCAAGLNTNSPGAATPSPSPKPAAATPTPKPTPTPPPAGGIGQASDQAAAQALELLNNGKLPEAFAAYQSLIKQFPNSGDVPEAMFRMGYIQYVQGDYPGAVTTLRRIVSPPASADVKAAGDALIPQILAAQASKLSFDDPKRKQGFQDAIKQFDAFIQANPKNPDVDTALYGRGVAAYQSGDYDEALKSLQQDLNQFPNSESMLDTEDLMAVTLTAQASTILRDHGDEQAAMGKFGDALKSLAYIIQSGKDVALANDAQFQAGEVLFNRGGAEDGEKRKKDLTNAISVYREVRPKELMVQAQQARVNDLLARRRDMVVHGNMDGAKAVQRVQDRENAKLDALKNAADQTMNAQLRIAASFFMLEKYDEARVLLNFLQGFADNDDQKKQISYYVVLTYASQRIADKAVSAYDDFKSKYKNDPLGENLPLAMGSLFLDPKVNQPDKAIAYLQEEITLFPKSSLVNDALGQEAQALIGLKRYPEALSAYQKYLGTNPPKEQAAQSELGLAEIFQATEKLPEAIKQYQKVAETYEGLPQAEQGAFYAAGLQISVDPPKALPLLQAYVKKFADGKNAAKAMMMIGQVQGSMGQLDAAMQSYKDLVEKFPKTDLAPQAVFAQATILAKEQKTDDMVKLLRDFIKTYNDDKDIFYAYETIGQTQVTKGDVAGAINTYTEMASEHADNPKAATALYRTAELWRKQADALGRYMNLNETQRKQWSDNIASSVDASEKLVEQFPDSDQVGLALKTLLADQEMLLSAKQKTPDDLDKYFHGLADKFGDNPALKSRILFTLATYTYGKDPAKALVQMSEAYNPSLVYAPADLDLYGEALIDQGKAAEAYKIYEKLGKDFPNPEGTEPVQAPQQIQEAQATAFFGMGAALAKQGKTAESGKLFSQMKTLYPWFPKVVEANYYIAKSLVEEKKLGDALKLLIPTTANRNAPSALRARSLVLIGDIDVAQNNNDAAMDTYLKAAFQFGGVADAAAEGFWKGAQLLEKQAGLLNETSTPKRSAQIQKAINAYKAIVTKYPNSPHLKDAQERLDALGAK